MFKIVKKIIEKLKIKLSPRFVRKIYKLDEGINNIDSKLNNIKSNNIAIIKCSGNLNVGNEFINNGGIQLLKTIFKNYEFYEYVFYNSQSSKLYKYNSKAILDNDIKLIENNCSLMFILCGSLITENSYELFLELSKINIHKSLLGISCLLYNDAEKELCKKIVNMYDEIFTRDNITYSFFNNAPNVYSAIDLAFFAKEIIYNKYNNKGDYAIINIDLIDEYRNNLHSEYNNIYVLENTSSPYYNIKDFIYHSYWDSLYRLISNAKFVVTNRIHTTVVCISNCVPFLYIGEISTDVKNDRDTLFHMIDFILEKNVIYRETDIDKYLKIIDNKKYNFRVLLNKVYSSYIK